MNLIIRMIKTFIVGLLAARQSLFDVSRIQFRVWPNDLDINFHMNNGRYLTLMDLGRTHLALVCGLGGVMWKRRWMPVLGGAIIRFRREIAPFQKFTLSTKIVCWDEKWIYMEQRFESLDGRILASALVRGLFVEKGKKVTPQQILEVMGEDAESPEMPAHIADWVKAEDEWRPVDEAWTKELKQEVQKKAA